MKSESIKNNKSQIKALLAKNNKLDYSGRVVISKDDEWIKEDEWDSLYKKLTDERS